MTDETWRFPHAEIEALLRRRHLAEHEASTVAVGEVPVVAASTTETSPQAAVSPSPNSGDTSWISKGTAQDRLDDAHHAAMDSTP